MIQQTPNALQVLDQQFIDRKAEFQAALPSNCTVERFTRIVKTAAIQTPELLTADRPSLFMACFKAAQDGLLPDGRECALVIYPTKQKNGTYKNIVQYTPMYGGILKKVRNSGELASISAHVVYEEDAFDYCLGDDEHITHKPAIANNGKAICAYVIVKTKDGAVYREVMSTSEIEKIRLKSKMKEGMAWRDHWGEMAKKTVIRRISKRLPMSSDLETVIQRDDEMFEFDNKTQVSTSNVVDSLNQQIIDVSDAEIIENQEEPDISPEVLAKAEELFNKEGK